MPPALELAYCEEESEPSGVELPPWTGDATSAVPVVAELAFEERRRGELIICCTPLTAEIAAATTDMRAEARRLGDRELAELTFEEQQDGELIICCTPLLGPLAGFAAAATGMRAEARRLGDREPPIRGRLLSGVVGVDDAVVVEDTRERALEWAVVDEDTLERGRAADGPGRRSCLALSA